MAAAASTMLPPAVNDGPGILALTWVEAAIGLTVLGARVYTRGVIVGKIGIDDWMMIFTAALCVVMSALVTVAVHAGFGQHAAYLALPKLIQAIKYFWLASPFAIMSTCFGKISIALLLMRIVNRHKVYIAFLWTLIALLLSVHIVVLVVNFKQCDPTYWLWERLDPATTVDGSCWNPNIQKNYGYFQGAFAAFSDLLLALFPILIFRDLQMELKLKIGLTAAMALGVLATAAAVVKTIELKTLATPDFTYNARELMFWFVSESWIIVIAACIPTLAPLYFVLTGERTRGSYAVSKNSKSGGQGRSGSKWPRSLVRGLRSGQGEEGEELDEQPLADLEPRRVE